MLQRNKNEQIMFKPKNLEKSHKYKIEQKKQDGKKKHVLYDSTWIKFGKRKKSSMVIEVRVMIILGENGRTVTGGGKGEVLGILVMLYFLI